MIFHIYERTGACVPNQEKYCVSLWYGRSNATFVAWQEPLLPVLVSDLDFPPVADMTPQPLPPSLLQMQCVILTGQKVNAVLLNLFSVLTSLKKCGARREVCSYVRVSEV
jgi:hypothetical protein